MGSRTCFWTSRRGNVAAETSMALGCAAAAGHVRERRACCGTSAAEDVEYFAEDSDILVI